LVTGSAGALGGDEPEHVNRLDVRRRLRDHGEEHPQVVGRSQHRVRTTPALKELQIIVDQRHADPQDRLSAGTSGADQAGIGDGHFEASSSIDGQSQRLVEMFRKITCITSMSGRLSYW
jgi:hypothetical protein